MIKILIFLIYIIFNNSQTNVIYNGINVCNNKSQFEYVQIFKACTSNIGPSSTQYLCTSTGFTINLFSNPNVCSGSITNTYTGNYVSCGSTYGENNICEPTVNYNGALLLSYGDVGSNTCYVPSTSLYIFQLNTCILSKDYPNYYVSYSCNNNNLTQSLYSNQNCVGHSNFTYLYASSTCSHIPGIGNSFVTTCNGNSNGNINNPVNSRINSSYQNKFYFYLYIISLFFYKIITK